uniref:Replication-associated protein n=1 Tax=Grus japonensis parvo-like hybrid virus TaxID=2794511 RepID=A0A8A4XDX8_9VIRU|nr:MAG: replication protein [Grus japonensis parvo-like hybrid virus]
MLSSTQPKTVSYKTEDRQWDARFNVQSDDDLNNLLEGVKQLNDEGRFKYVLVGGLEIGTRSYQDDYGIRHVHAAFIFVNRHSKRSILNSLKIKEGNGYYLVPRNRDLGYAGWRNHHIKPFSKVDPDKLLLFESGDLPKDLKRKAPEATEEEKKLKVDEIIRIMRTLIEEDKEAEAFERFPRNWLLYGERLKSMCKQRKLNGTASGNPNLWITGYPGTGKTAILNYIYPQMFKKNLYNKFFDLYNQLEHTHVMLEDLDHEAVEKLSINFIKTLCDEAGFAIDQKYKSPQLARTTVLVTSNFTIKELVPEGAGYDQNLAAIGRRFWQANIYEFLRLLQLKLIPKEDRAKLKGEGNTETGKLFMDWDYLTNGPTGKEIKTPEEYENIVKDYFYAMSC